MTALVPIPPTFAQIVSFAVYGRPQQKGSKRVFPVRSSQVRDRAPRQDYIVRDDNPRAKPWASTISARAAEAYSGPLIRSAVGVELAFYFRRPKGHFGTGRNASRIKPGAPVEMITTPDVDKLARCAIDALTGIVIADDSLIVELCARKLYGEPERVEVRVLEFAEGPS